jgi:hypothetical protein
MTMPGVHGQAHVQEIQVEVDGVAAVASQFVSGELMHTMVIRPFAVSEDGVCGV